MTIGVPKEIKDHEARVALVPGGVIALKEAGHEVLVQASAGLGAVQSLTRNTTIAGATILPTAEEVWAKSDLIVKVKKSRSPLSSPTWRPGLTLFTYLHLAPLLDLTNRLLETQTSGVVAYETIREADGSLPLLTPMSEVAGRMAVQIGAQYLEAQNGGRGILASGVLGVAPANVTIIGGGVVGTNASEDRIWVCAPPSPSSIGAFPACASSTTSSTYNT